MNKYVVFKTDDLLKYLDDVQARHLNDIIETVEAGREADGKPKYNEYVLVNKDAAKAFIVTSGSHSDYRINNVFLDRNEAEKYASVRCDRIVEEHDFVEIREGEQEIRPVVYVNYTEVFNGVNIGHPEYDGRIIVKSSIETSSSIDGFEDLEEINYYEGDIGIYNSSNELYRDYQGMSFRSITLRRVVKEKMGDPKKYEKVCQDLMAQAKHLRANGFSRYDLCTILNGRKE